MLKGNSIGLGLPMIPPNSPLKIFFLVFFSFEAIFGNAQGLLLTLHPGITPRGTQETIWNAEGT